MGRRHITAEDVYALHRLTGKGIWHLQHVEDALSTFITLKLEVKTRGAMPLSKAEEILSKHRSHTLGKALGIARKGQVFGPALQARLDKFKNERDWLVHRSLTENGDDLYMAEKRNLLLNRLKAFSEEAINLQRLIYAKVEEFVVAQGISREWIENDAARRLKALTG